MDFFTGSNDLGTLGLGLLIAGAAAGLFRGMLGAGAGLILVPVLYDIFGELGLPQQLRFQMAASTALLCLLPTTLAAAAREKDTEGHARLIKSFAPIVGIGVLLGVLLRPQLPTAILVAIFAFVAIIVALQTLFISTLKNANPSPLLSNSAAGSAGFIAALIGIGGASLFLPLLALIGLSEAKAKTVSSALAVITCLIGAIAGLAMGWNAPDLPKYSYGYLNLLAFGIVAPVMYATSALSAHYGASIEAKRPRATFALFMLIMAGKMVWDCLR
jgi:uncharacterized membrane protein YfcA